MERKNLYLLVGAIALVVILVFIIIAIATSSPDISGTYELFLAGKPTGTIVTIKAEGNDYYAIFTNNNNLLSKYVFPRPHGGNTFVIEKRIEGINGNRFELQLTENGLKGKADIHDLAKGIEVFLKKINPTN